MNLTRHHLSSTTALSDASGNRQEYDSNDAWGLGRNANGNPFGTGCLTIRPPSGTLRRFTGQEAMDSFCLINLNGRIYDPALGRMLSADPMVSMPTYGQSFDRYTYALNNPLIVTDPSGYTSDTCPGQGCPTNTETVSVDGYPTGPDVPGSCGEGCYTNPDMYQNLAGSGQAGAGASGANYNPKPRDTSATSTDYILPDLNQQIGQIVPIETLTVTVPSMPATTLGSPPNFSALGSYLLNNFWGNSYTTVELRFRHVFGTQFQHAFIVVTNNYTGVQWVSQAGPSTPPALGGGDACDICMDTLWPIDEAWTEPWTSANTGYTEPYTVAETFTTDLSATSVEQDLTSFGNEWNQMGYPYVIPSPDSNSYGGGGLG